MGIGEFLKNLILSIEGGIRWFFNWIWEGDVYRILALIIVIFVGALIFSLAKKYLFDTSDFCDYNF